MTTRWFTGTLTVAGVVCVCAAGCGASVSPELRSARSLMAQAQAEDTARRNPKDIRLAQRDLAAAEAAHEADPGSQLERDRAYVAERRIHLAMEIARRERTAERDRADQVELTEDLGETARLRTRESGVGREQLGFAEGRVTESPASLDSTAFDVRAREQQLLREREARRAVENDLAAMTTQLEDVGRVRADGDSIVITLPSTVLFRSGQSQLLPEAGEVLSRVAEVIRSHPGRAVTVVGHTDSAGRTADNERLSLARASIVRTAFLASAPGTHIQILGLGETQPVANNDTADGRADNRRLEVILRPSTPLPATPTP